MDDGKLFELVRKNYNIANKDYIKEQVKAALKEPAMAKQETLDGLIDWIVEAGCTGMNEHYRKFVFSAVAYLLKEQEAKIGHWIIVEYDTLTCSCCGKSYYTGCDSTKEATANLEKGNVYRYCPYCGSNMESR